jgi:hypothetical protein
VAVGGVLAHIDRARARLSLRVAAFVLNTIDHRVYPLALAIEVFVAAILVTLLARAQHTQPRPALAMHACCVLFYMARNAHDLEMPDRQFWYSLWVLDFAARPHSGHAWFALIATCAWTLAFWIGGHGLVSGSRAYLAVCARSDRGLGWLFALLLFKLLLGWKPPVHPQTSLHSQFDGSHGQIVATTPVAFAFQQVVERDHALYFAVGDAISRVCK